MTTAQALTNISNLKPAHFGLKNFVRKMHNDEKKLLTKGLDPTSQLEIYEGATMNFLKDVLDKILKFIGEVSIREIVTMAVILISSYILIIITKAAIGFKSFTELKEILTIILPVLSTWVGTVLAFYFGRENFESATKQLQQVVRQLTPDEKSQLTVDQVMKPYVETTSIKLDESEDVSLVAIDNEFQKSEITRLPIVRPNRSPKYMIHISRFWEYKSDKSISPDITGKKLTDFIKFFGDKNQKFDLNNGFIVVASGTTLAHAKSSLEEKKGCADIFITKNGNADEPFLGWISNTDLLKALK